MNINRCPLVVVLPALILSTGMSAAADPEPKATEHHRPPDPEPVAAADLEAALQRGVNYLVQNQNKDGSWGSPALEGGVAIYAGIGSHHAFQVAVTAMSVMALIESGDDSSTVLDAIERGEKHLFK